MSGYKLTILLILVWITTGCQQAYQNTSSNIYTGEPVNTVNVPQETIAHEDSNSYKENQTASKPEKSEGDEQVTTINKPINIEEEPDLNNTTEDNTSISNSKQESEKEDNNSDQAAAQEKIDQALELCEYAQQMWEKGKLQEALNNLDSAYYSIIEIDSEVYPDFNQQKEDIRFLISKRILEIYASRQIVANGQHNEIPITLNKYVKDEIKILTGRDRKFFEQSLERSQRYRPFIVAELKKAGLPEEISWLPLIESGFKIRALSRARALGLWQFIPSTGYKFGLSRNYYIDERLDPEKATIAAIAYLKELHKLFGDWTTALAAYNCGEYRVLRIIRRQKINYLDNFWDLFQSLPRETARYVPKFLATLHIINNLEKYNIKTGKSLSPIKYKTFEIKKQVRLEDIAKEINVSSKILKDLNPELRYALLPSETYQLKIPEEKAHLFLAKIDKIKTTYSPPPMYVYHRVKRGDTLSGLAKKYRTSISAISKANHINRRHTIIAGKVLKIPSRNNNIKNTAIASNKIEPGKTVEYKVKRGDSLWIIARKFGTTTKTIQSVNKLNNTTLNIGQKLYITSKEQVKIAKNGGSTYRVRSGDSPFLIAKKHNMNLNRFLALNHLSKRSTIFPGQKLIVE
ncbi:MAG: LysM peptidoglycan-binding domain-containing protein [Deltaproteobacteria bacterium]|jgi:membrane-bound lytic murein transglycosylase D|nr:LysM peptidoglycan-binding domain-containing protein [Deltaproteobacteria bacterium]